MKIVDKKLMSIYEDVYKECGVNFHEIKEKNKDWWFMEYYLPTKKQEEILNKHLRWVRSKYIKNSISTNFWLGCSPTSSDFYWKLTKKDFKDKSSRIKWVEYDKFGKYLSDYPLISVGRHLIMIDSGWETSEVTEIIKHQRDCIIFKTLNSEYELTRFPKTN